MFNFTNFLSKIKLPFFTGFEVYFDFGTSESKIGIKDKGVVLREPTILAYNSRASEYLFFGNEAKAITGKTPDFIKIIKPVNSGVVSDFDAQVALTKKYLERSAYLYFSNQMIKPALTGFAVIPTTATEIEQKALQEALYKSGLSQVFLIEKGLATAAGCNLNIFSHQPNLIVDLGGGLIEIEIVGSGGIISQRTLKTAGENMNKLIFNYIYLKYGVILGEATCEELKVSLLNFFGEEKTVTIRGKSLETGLPKSVKVKSSDIKEALLSNFNQIVDAVKETIESAPPEIIDEIIERGIYITGGLSKIIGIEKFFEQEIKIKMINEQPYLYATINGLSKLAKDKENLSKIIFN